MRDPAFCSARGSYVEPAARHDLGRMVVRCGSCNALHWPSEKLKKSPQRTPRFGLCCNSGKVKLPVLRAPPPLLRGLLEGDDAVSRNFRADIRQYNMALAFTSLGVNADEGINASGRSGYVYRIHGELYHHSGALENADGTRPVYSQLYIYDPRIALDHRRRRNENLDPRLLAMLDIMLRQVNPYAHIYLRAYEILSEEGSAPDAWIRLRVTPGCDRRRYNEPTAEEVAMILPGDGSANEKRDIVIYKRLPEGQRQLFRISECHAAYAPLHYVLLFPYGEYGWYPELELQ
ncbi:hypothetical protein EV715DRAFT_207123, partial [Schizophyllum commune]